MKFVLLVLFAFSSLPARAETPPPRHALMEVTYASGFYEPARGATLELRYDGDGSPHSLTLTVPGRKLTARIWRVSPSRCGDRLYARLSIPDDQTATDIVLTDFTAVRCRIYVKHRWHADVDTREPDGSLSRMLLEGDPRPQE